ncbi:MAG: hypothetical protein CMJ87_04350 [Planctomycetes bacterium]|nr:hypothetical protein [Planctomycetota bacterium]
MVQYAHHDEAIADIVRLVRLVRSTDDAGLVEKLRAFQFFGKWGQVATWLIANDEQCQADDWIMSHDEDKRASGGPTMPWRWPWSG